MAIRIQCTNCDAINSFHENQVGTAVPCMACEQPIVVVQSAALQPVESRSTSGVYGDVICPNCDTPNPSFAETCTGCEQPLRTAPTRDPIVVALERQNAMLAEQVAASRETSRFRYAVIANVLLAIFVIWLLKSWSLLVLIPWAIIAYFYARGRA